LLPEKEVQWLLDLSQYNVNTNHSYTSTVWQKNVLLFPVHNEQTQ
jgi:hypothetical protein